METSLPKINPTSESPFEGDLLERATPAATLRTLVDTFSEGCVMGLNGKWGSGKTTFLNMWKKYMERLGYKVIYFNSWENDGLEDPLIPIIGEFYKLTNSNDSKWNAFTNNIGKISLAMLPTIMGMIAKELTGLPIKEIIQKGGEEGSKILGKAIETYNEQRKSVAEFKKALKEYVEENSNCKPVIFIIDELDRCTPSFAVKTLERIKHFFEVENIVYLLAIDEVQLANSIRGFYGSEQFDAKDYLRRFICISYELPSSDVNNIVETLFKRYHFPKIEGKVGKYESDYNELCHFIRSLYEDRKMTIRQLEQYMLYLRIAIESMLGLSFSTTTIALMTLLKLHDSEFFEKYLTYKVDDNEFIRYIENHFGIGLLNGHTPISMQYFYPSVADMMKIRYTPDERENALRNEDGTLKFQTTKLDPEQFPRCFTNIDLSMPGLDVIRERLYLLSSINLNL